MTAPPSAAGRRRAYFHLQVAAHRLHTIANEHMLATAGVSAAQVGALFAIAASPGTNQRALADTLRQRESAVTGMVNRLLKAGLVERHRDDNDQRARQLWLTPEGERALATIRADTEELNRLIDDAVGHDGVDAFVDGLEALADLAKPEPDSRPEVGGAAGGPDRPVETADTEEERSMTITWAYIYEHPDSDPAADRTVLDRSGQRTLLVPVPSAGKAPGVARKLVADDDVRLIELCGGFSLADAAKVADAVGQEVPVGHVSFAVDSAPGVAAYAAAFEASVDGTGQ